MIVDIGKTVSINIDSKDCSKASFGQPLCEEYSQEQILSTTSYRRRTTKKT